MLVSLSRKREQLLIEDPALVLDIVSTPPESPIAGALPLPSCWVELQKLLFDYQWGTGAEDSGSAAIPLGAGLMLYESDSVHPARRITPEAAARIARWVASLPEDVLTRAREQSPQSMTFPQSLGRSQLDAREPFHSWEPPRPASAADLEAALMSLKAFYRGVLEQRHGVLAIRYWPGDGTEEE